MLPDPSLVIGIALNRRRRGFSPRDRQLCNLLRPHLLQAYRGVEAAAQTKLLASTFEQAAGGAGVGLVRLDPDRQPRETNAAAHSILHRFFDPYAAASLPHEISQWLARDHARDTPAELVLHRRDGRRLIIHRAPAPAGDLLLLSEQPTAPLDARALGLTTREAQVLELVRGGLPTKRIAAALDISPRTVEKHIHHALDKLGVRTRLQALALIERVQARPPIRQNRA